jgi:hypothetical protein
MYNGLNTSIRLLKHVHTPRARALGRIRSRNGKQDIDSALNGTDRMSGLGPRITPIPRSWRSYSVRRSSEDDQRVIPEQSGHGHTGRESGELDKGEDK